MAFKNKQISNPKTGHNIKFIRTAKETAGKLLEMDLDRAYTADFESDSEKAQNPADAEVDFYIIKE